MPEGKNPGLKVVTINIPIKYIGLIDKLVGLGVYPSRSETIRAMLGEWLTVKLKNIDTIDMFIEQADKLLDYNKYAKNTHRKYSPEKEKIGIKRAYEPKIIIETSFVNEKIVESDGEKFKIRALEKLHNETWLDKNLDGDGFIKSPKVIDIKFMNED